MTEYIFKDLKDKVAVITGGGGVIGQSLSLAMGKAGMKIAIMDINSSLADQTATRIKKETGAVAFGVAGNVLDHTSLVSAKSAINERMGPVHFLINCAGGNSPKATTKVEFVTEETISELGNTFFGLQIDGFRDVFDLNFLGTVLPTMVFARDMVDLKKGAVVNISSMNSFRPLTKIPAYSAAKAAINNFTQWLAVHLAKVNVRVNAIAPGFFVTRQNRFLLIDKKTEKLTPRGKKIINGTPMERFGNPEDLQGTLLFLLSGASSFVTGVVIPVDGGFSAYSGV